MAASLRAPSLAFSLLIALEGGGDGVTFAGSHSHSDNLFVSRFERQVIPRVGHNLPQETPQEFAAAVSMIGRLGLVDH